MRTQHPISWGLYTPAKHYLAWAVAAASCLAARAGGAPASPGRISVTGDRELLRQVAMAHQDNRERLRAWRGEARIDHREHDVADPEPAREAEAARIGRVAFVQTRHQLRSHWIDEAVRHRAGDSRNPLDNCLRFYHQMRRDDGICRYRGLVQASAGSQLVIFAPGEPPTYEDFDPMAFLQKDFGGDDYERLLTHLLDVSSGPACDLPPDAEETRITIDARGREVDVRLAADRTGKPPLRDLLQFDLSRGGNLVWRQHEGANAIMRVAIAYEERDGVWLPHRYSEVRTTCRAGIAGTTSARQVTFSTAAVNQPVDDAEFTLNKLGVQPGDVVTDRRHGGLALSFEYTGAGGIPEQELSRFTALLAGPNSGAPTAAPGDAGRGGPALVPPRSPLRQTPAPGLAFRPGIRSVAALGVCCMAVTALWVARTRRNLQEATP